MVSSTSTEWPVYLNCWSIYIPWGIGKWRLDAERLYVSKKLEMKVSKSWCVTNMVSKYSVCDFCYQSEGILEVLSSIDWTSTPSSMLCRHKSTLMRNCIVANPNQVVNSEIETLCTCSIWVHIKGIRVTITFSCMCRTLFLNNLHKFLSKHLASSC